MEVGVGGVGGGGGIYGPLHQLRLGGGHIGQRVVFDIVQNKCFIPHKRNY